jgi:TolB-like protein
VTRPGSPTSPDKDAQRTTLPPPTPDRAKRFTSTGVAMTILAALLVAGAGAWVLSSKRGVTAVAAVTSTPAADAAVTLAVLPFADMSPAHDQEYFSDGLTEELLNQLAQIKALRVTARTSSFSFKGKGEDMRVIGEKLGVANLLEGSVRKDGNQLRITAQLISGRDGTHLWSKTYDRELSGIFALQEEVAKDVAEALSVTLDVGELPRIQGGTTDVEAYEKYLQARELYLQGGLPQTRPAVQLLREALVLDPQFSRAWLLLAYTLPETMVGSRREDTTSIRAEAAAASERVLELAPDAWWSHALRANQLLGRRQWAQAESEMNAAVNSAVLASTADLVDGRGQILRRVGRVREGLSTLEQERERNPLSLVASTELQIFLDAAGQPDLAQEEYLRSRDLAGTHQRANIFALMRLLSRDDAKPEEISEQFRTLLASESLRMPLSHSLAATFNDPKKAREAIRQAIEDPANQDTVRMSVVAMYADAFNERDLALTAFRRAVIDFHSDAIVWNAYRSGLRTDPRFKDILREIGLVDYFRASGKWGDYCRPLGEVDFECH